MTDNLQDFMIATIQNHESFAAPKVLNEMKRLFGTYGGQLRPSAAEWSQEGRNIGEHCLAGLGTKKSISKEEQTRLLHFWRGLELACMTHASLGALYGKDSGFEDEEEVGSCVQLIIVLSKLLEMAGVPPLDTRPLGEVILPKKMKPLKGGDMDFDELVPVVTLSALSTSCPEKADHDLNFAPRLALDGELFPACAIERDDKSEVLLLLFPNHPVYDPTTRQVLVEAHYLRTTPQQLQGTSTTAWLITDMQLTPKKVEGVSEAKFTTIKNQLDRNKASVSLRCQASRRRAHGFVEARKCESCPSCAAGEPHMYMGSLRKKRLRAFSISYLVYDHSFLTPETLEWADDAAALLKRKKTTAATLKTTGNEAYTKEEYESALRYYALAIHKDNFACGASDRTADASIATTLYANTAACFLGMNEAKMAVRCCTKGLSYYPAPEERIRDKMLFRRTSALAELCNTNKARTDVSVTKDNVGAERLDKKPKSKPATPVRVSSLSEAAFWTKDLTVSQQHEVLVDCYRTRLDDEAMHTLKVRGLYDCEEPESIVFDFMIFAKLCVEHGVTPVGWDWEGCLKGPAVHLLRHAFGRQELQEKYGVETGTVVATSFGYIAEKVYASTTESKTVSDAQRVMGMHVGVFNNNIEAAAASGFLEGIGGGKAWIGLFEALGGEVKTRAPGPKKEVSTGIRCRFFARGHCLNGVNCRFRHEV